MNHISPLIILYYFFDIIQIVLICYDHNVLLYSPFSTNLLIASFTSFKSSLYVTPCHVAVVPITLTLATSSSIASNNTSGIKNSADAALSLFSSKN